MTSIDWDDTIADKVAAKVLDKIGDQLKVSEPFAEALDHMMECMSDGSYQVQMVGYGPCPIRVGYRMYRDRIRIEFESCNGTPIGNWTLHT